MLGPESGIAAASERDIRMALIAMSKTPRRPLIASAALLAAVSLAVAPGAAYAQRGGGGGGYGGGYAAPYAGAGYGGGYGYAQGSPGVQYYAPYSGASYGQPNQQLGIPGSHQPSASSHPPY